MSRTNWLLAGSSELKDFISMTTHILYVIL